MADLNMSVTELKRCVLVKLSGRIDSSKAGEVERVFQDLESQGRFRIVLDMSEVEYISSAFLRVLITHMKKAKRFNRGNIYLAAMPPRIRDVFELSGLLPVFKVYDTVVEAVGDW
ncbi:MAG: STAS domain-containing protein [Caldilineales bacterium]|nr:STAS domain-containing protein [Caldilineales bacterium]MDW8319342.1 STAS domain-containing protein [Anaerolineae bacterium]